LVQADSQARKHFFAEEVLSRHEKAYKFRLTAYSDPVEVSTINKVSLPTSGVIPSGITTNVGGITLRFLCMAAPNASFKDGGPLLVGLPMVHAQLTAPQIDVKLELVRAMDNLGRSLKVNGSGWDPGNGKIAWSLEAPANASRVTLTFGLYRTVDFEFLAAPD
jgi:hypothetical protein